MGQNNNKLNNKQQKTLLKLFLKAAGITLIAGVVLVGALAGVYYGFLYDGKPATTTSSDVVISEEEQVKEEEKSERSAINQTVAVFGVDKDGTRTDVIFVVNFNSSTNKIKVLSIPRDTKVNWTDKQNAKLMEVSGYTRSVSKINEMTAYGGINNIRDFTIDEIENILGVKIDNYVLVGLDSFRQIVDAVGGVEVEVPAFRGNGLQYDDYDQNLHIHLDPGVQVLDGAQAEGLIRFRKDNYGNSYPEGDKDRIKVQQEFLDALAHKVLSPAIIPRLYNIISTVFANVSTDVRLTEIPKYLTYLNGFSTDNIEFYIVDGEGAMENGASYYFIDYDKLDETIQKVFYDTEAATDGEGDETTDSTVSDEIVVDKTVKVEIYNATGTNGIAGGLKDKLEKLGYTVPRIDNYTKENLAGTLVYAKDEAKAKQFLEYLPEDTMVVESQTIDQDVQIIVGTDYLQ